MDFARFPDSIESVVFADNTATIKAFCGKETYKLANECKVVANDPGRMTIKLSSPANKVIKVSVQVHKNTPRAKKTTIVDLPLTSNATLEQVNDEVIFKSGTLSASIPQQGQFGIRFSYCGSPILTGKKRTFYLLRDRIGARFDLMPDEIIYGLGSAGASIARSGYRSNDPIPFYVSTEGFGIFINSAKPAKIDIGSTAMFTDFSVDTSELEFAVIAGDSMPEILQTYASLTGNMLAPDCANGGIPLRFGADFTITSDDITNLITSFTAQGIRIKEIWLGNSWHPAYDITGFQWDLTRFPNPEGLMRIIHDAGIRFGLSISPVLSDNSPDFQEVLDYGYLLGDKEGNAVILDVDAGNCGIINLGDLVARNWFTNQCDSLLHSGVDFLESDIPDLFTEIEGAENFPEILNSTIPECEIRMHSRGSVLVMANGYGTGNGNVPFANLKAVGYPTYATLTDTLKSAISLGLSGFPSVNVDVPSSSTCSKDVYIKYLQLAFFAPHFRLNESHAKITPDGMDPEIFSILKSLNNIRESLMPYIYSAIAEGCNYGLPSMRLMSMEFPTDIFARGVENQYMLGDSLLIAPVLKPAKSVRAYIPAGTWTDLMTYETIRGPRYTSRNVETGSVPIYVRPNSVIATRTPDTGSGDVSMLDNLTFTCFALEDGQVAACEVFEAGMNHSGLITVAKEGKKITVKTQRFGKNKRIVFAGINNVVSSSESIPEQMAYGTMIEFTSPELIVTLG
ncbi:MAG: hypothetical protein K5745_01435 [Saccharofermentans sp.]|nr:hypothetical protein [Saccharofermentans sp.]